MNELDDQKIREALKRSFPAVETSLPRDLWPDLLRKLDAQPQAVPWYDWVLLALSAGALFYFPPLVLVFAYHL